MADNLRILRRKRKVVGEIRQITRAMKLVSAAKLRRAMATAEKVDYYSSQLSGAIRLAVAAVGPDAVNQYTRTRPVVRHGLLVVGSDRGLCGAYNSSIVARAVEFAQAQQAEVVALTVGGRTAEMVRRARLHVTREFPALADKLQGQDAAQMASHLMRLYERGEVDQITVCYARFVSRLVYEPTTFTLLPVPLGGSDEDLMTDVDGHLFEPEPERLIRDLMPQYLRARMHGILVEAATSEHSARLLAMSAATENAEDMLEGLTRHINRARQAQVTSELLDVVSGADALTHQA